MRSFENSFSEEALAAWEEIRQELLTKEEWVANKKWLENPTAVSVISFDDIQVGDAVVSNTGKIGHVVIKEKESSKANPIGPRYDSIDIEWTSVLKPNQAIPAHQWRKSSCFHSNATAVIYLGAPAK